MYVLPVEYRQQGCSNTTHEGSMMSRPICMLAVMLVASVVCMPVGSSAQSVGEIAAIEEKVELGRNGSWSRAILGDGVEMGDRIRSDVSGRVRVVFSDGSVVVVAPRSEIRVDRHVFDPDGETSSVFEVLKGKMRSIVSEYYETSGTFEVNTPNAVSGVRGTDFIVVHDPSLDTSEVVGVSGRVVVRSARNTAGSAAVTTKQLSVVAGDQPPSAPVALTDEQFRYYLEDLEFVGGGRPESLFFNQPVLVDETVPEPERASGAVPSRAATGPAARLDVDAIPGEVDDRSPDGAGLAGEPAEAVDSGDLGIRF